MEDGSGISLAHKDQFLLWFTLLGPAAERTKLGDFDIRLQNILITFADVYDDVIKSFDSNMDGSEAWI